MVSYACMFGKVSIKQTVIEGMLLMAGVMILTFNTYEKINLNILNNIPLFGVRALDASQNVFKMHALPSNPCLLNRSQKI